MNVLIVDDEPLAIELLEGYVLKMTGFTLIGKCSNALEAFSILNKEQVDAIFLDINMPEITGIGFLKMLKNPPLIVLTTAYSEYAADSYNYDVVDYLLKPITFERFAVATNKLLNTTIQKKDNAKPEDDILFVRSEGKMTKVDLRDLYIVEGYKNYVRLWIGNEKIIVHNTMKNVEEFLKQNPAFLRVHKSYIINMKYVSEVFGNCIKVKNETIVIGPTFKNEIEIALQKYDQL